ncbi:MAG: hypothetical protein CL840_17805 [Crocinitomicaceae bacterium]|nr:hypothetical protein [Crocinitomicaceae bacterium]|tara:strand:+ start:798 stop:1679 length:882 start_codon:yes stop_codon:yes gene_type:complete
MKKIIASGLILSSIAFFAACDSGSEDGSVERNSAEEAQEEMLDEMAEEGEGDVVESFYLPSALQIGSIFQKSGLKYLPNLTNSVDNLNKYETKSSKILNFGVYSADLAYIVLNGQSQDATNYLKVVSDLSNEIGFGSVFESKDLMSRFESNLGNRDSIINVMIDIQARTDMFVDDNNLQDVTYIIFAGAWVEGMYLGVEASDNESRHALSGRLVEQMTILDNLVKALKSNKNQTEEVAELTKKLSELEKFFYKLEENKNSQNIKSFKDYKISQEHLDELSKTILELRASIVNG